MKLKENYIGSYLLILIGFLLFFLPILTHRDTDALTGFAIVFIALAYMSAKYRRVNVLMLTAFRGGYEFLLVLVSSSIVFTISIEAESLLTIGHTPLFVWLTGFIGYVVINIGNRENDKIIYKDTTRKNQNIDNKSKGGFITHEQKDKNIVVNSDVRKTEFFGSSAAIGLGILYFLSGVNAVAQKTGGSTDGLIFGLVIILGALAYKSAKRRKLELKPNSLIRIGFEIIAIALILASVLLSNFDIKQFIAERPFPFLIWLWVLVAYLYIVASGTYKSNKDSDLGEDGYSESIGGWLILLGFGIVVGVLRMLMGLLKDYSFYSEGILSVLNSGNAMAVFNGGEASVLFWLLVFEFVGGAIFLLLSIYIAYLFFQKKASFPNAFINVTLWLLLFNLIDLYVASTLTILNDTVDAETTRFFVGFSVYAFAWIMYLNKSDRVKNTFIN